MKAEITLNNVGGLEGKNNFSLDCGKINFIEAPNAAGKSSLVKALTAILSVPKDDFSPKFLEDAQNLGIRKSEKENLEGFVNINTNEAKVELSINGNTFIYNVTKNGRVKEVPNGDERFLLTGVLSNESRVVSQLTKGRGDFNWIVKDLSFAGQYEDFKDFAENKKDEILKEKTRVIETLDRLESIENDLLKLNKRKEELEKNKRNLESKVDKELYAKLSKRDAVLKKINTDTEALGRLKSDIINAQKEVNRFEKEIKDIGNSINKKEKELKTIDIEKLKKESEIKIKELEDLINEKKDVVNRARGLLDILQAAESEIKQMEKERAKCPLCKKSSLSKKEFESMLDSQEKLVRRLNSEIRELSEKKFNLESQKSDTEEKFEKLKDEISELCGDKNHINKFLEPSKSNFDTASEKFKRKEKELEEEGKRLKELKLEIKGNEYVEKKITEIEKEEGLIAGKISQINERKGEISNIIIGEKRLDPKEAEKVYNVWIEHLSDIINYVEEKQHEHEKKAKEEFNNTIKSILEKLDFKHFQQIKLNENNQLIVKRGNEYQLVKTLSTSEKMTVATILQLALKRAYLPEVPFFIIDEIILNYDIARKEKILNYLQDIAKKENLFVTITRLSKEKLSIK